MQVCPNCGAKQDELSEIKEGVWYCPHCDETYAITKGRPSVTEHKKTVLEAMSDKLKEVCDKVDSHDSVLNGQSPSKKQGIFDWMFGGDE